jgi:hypothetical protein
MTCGRVWGAVVAELQSRPPAVWERVAEAFRSGRLIFDAAPVGRGRVAATFWIDGRVVFGGEAAIDEDFEDRSP